MVKTKIVEWQHFFLVLDRFYHNRSASSPRTQLSKPTRVQKKWKFTPMMEGMRKISLLWRTITHAALPSCRVFLGVEHEIFNQTKVKTFVQSVGLILVRLGLQSAAGRRCERESDYHWYFSAHRAPDLPCSTASSMESMTVAYLSWKSMLKRKELLLADSTIELAGTLIEKTAAGRKKGNLASGLLVVVSAVLSLYVVQDYIGTATTQWRSESDMTKVELKSDKRFLEWRK